MLLPDALPMPFPGLTRVLYLVALSDRIAVGPAASPAEVVESALEASGYLEAVRSDDRGEDRLANLDILFEAAAGFADVASMLDELDKQAEADDAPRPRTAAPFQPMTLARSPLTRAMQPRTPPRARRRFAATPRALTRPPTRHPPIGVGLRPTSYSWNRRFP